MPSLSAEEERELQRAVSEHGRDWGAVAAARDWHGRSADVLRKAWDALSAQGVVASPAVVADPAEEALLAGPVVAVQPLPEGVARGAARCLHSGRPWDYITQRGGPREAPREPTDLQRTWIGGGFVTLSMWFVLGSPGLMAFFLGADLDSARASSAGSFSALRGWSGVHFV